MDEESTRRGSPAEIDGLARDRRPSRKICSPCKEDQALAVIVRFDLQVGNILSSARKGKGTSVRWQLRGEMMSPAQPSPRKSYTSFLFLDADSLKFS